MLAKDLKAGYYRDSTGHPYKVKSVTYLNAYKDRPALVEVVGATMNRNGQVVRWNGEWKNREETGMAPDAAPPKDLQ